MQKFSDEEFQRFIDTIAATTLANNAMITCMLAGVKVTAENVIPVVGRIVDPKFPSYEQLILAVEAQRAATVEAARSLALDIRKPG